ncbi:unnamed protein product [Anisakis simplex]|uniref:Uncharacterized protein n=1 Tax=Anisakis simplex TaxID=6269 RepID=A0A3P6NS38_ANISI|nr:unnamed protein product [Anisakis simplex]
MIQSSGLCPNVSNSHIISINENKERKSYWRTGRKSRSPGMISWRPFKQNFRSRKVPPRKNDFVVVSFVI